MSAESSRPSGSTWISAASISGVSGEVSACWICCASTASSLAAAPARDEAISINPPATMNGSLGSPGIRQSASAPKPATRSGIWLAIICRMMSEPMSASLTERVTIRPVATERSSAGICDTRPSPIDSRLYVVTASPNGMPSWPTPMANPPMRLTRVMMIAAIASPFTNFEAPSIEP